jgi:hypothetical protein
MEHLIQPWMLVLTLFLPRIGLLIAYFTHQIPNNSIPFIGDILLSIFLPRVLMLIYIADNLGTSSPWFWIHLVIALIVWFKSSKYANKKFRKK